MIFFILGVPAVLGSRSTYSFQLGRKKYFRLARSCLLASLCDIPVVYVFRVLCAGYELFCEMNLDRKAGVYRL